MMKPLLIVSMSTKSMMNDKKRSWIEQLDLCNKDETHSFLCFESFILIAEDQFFEHYLAPLLLLRNCFLNAVYSFLEILKETEPIFGSVSLFILFLHLVI